MGGMPGKLGPVWLPKCSGKAGLISPAFAVYQVRKPRSKAQRDEWLANGGQVVYNLPGWTLGFTTAMELYGEYPAAVAYVCKYIGKDGEKPAGRWYYSGGDLREPHVEYGELSPAQLAADYPGKVFTFNVPGRQMAVVNGVRDQVQNEVGEMDLARAIATYLCTPQDDDEEEREDEYEDGIFVEQGS